MAKRLGKRWEDTSILEQQYDAYRSRVGACTVEIKPVHRTNYSRGFRWAVHTPARSGGTNWYTHSGLRGTMRGAAAKALVVARDDARCRR